MSNRIYSKDKADWKVPCTQCGDDKVFTSRDSYANVLRQIQRTGISLCVPCRHKNKEGKLASEETKHKQSLAAKSRVFTPESDLARRQGISKSHQHRYASMSLQDRLVLLDKQKEGYKNRCPITKDFQYQKISEKRRLEMQLKGTQDTFQPSYNKATILYIEDILNVKFNTTFKHAENGGEFHIYNKNLRRSYYADAYCPVNNVWVEFDEKFHFFRGELNEACKVRQDEIVNMLGCMFLRVRFINNNIL